MIRSCQGWWSFTNAFFSNLKTVTLKVFVNYEGMKGYTLKDKTLVLYLKLIVKRFQKLCFVQSILYLLFVKLTAKTGD